MIIHKSFKHGWFYHYRIHVPKAEKLCGNGLSSLNKYLHDVKDNCPDDYFAKGPRSSGVKRALDVDIKKIKGHEVCALAQAGLEEKRYGTAHTNVQMFMLANDNNTISIEVPVWLMEKELSNYNELFNTTEVLTGHIDALRVEDGKIWVWDYKPKAHLEKYASTQVNFYSIMLSKRSGIPLENFRCGYFDDQLAFVFKPEKNVILK
jgi:hypothetical protein